MRWSRSASADVGAADERRGVVDVGVSRSDVHVAADDQRSLRVQLGDPSRHRLQERELARVLGAVERATIGHVDAGEADPSRGRLDPAGLLGHRIAGEAVLRCRSAPASRSSGPGSRRPPSARRTRARPRSRPPAAPARGTRRDCTWSPAGRATSGWCCSSSSSTRGIRTFSELTFQVTTRIGTKLAQIPSPRLRYGRHGRAMGEAWTKWPEGSVKTAKLRVARVGGPAAGADHYRAIAAAGRGQDDDRRLDIRRISACAAASGVRGRQPGPDGRVRPVGGDPVRRARARCSRTARPHGGAA